MACAQAAVFCCKPLVTCLAAETQSSVQGARVSSLASLWRNTASQSFSTPLSTRWQSARPVAQARRQAPRVAVAAVAEASAEEVVEGAESMAAGELLMFFKAEGAVSDASVPKIVKALEAVEGVSNVSITTSECGATVECTRLATIEATGVASGLVELLQAHGFKMQGLSLGFDNDSEEDDGYDYEMVTTEEEAVAEEGEVA